ncbi:MAG: type II secretion system F family protein [Verrucomicrobiota bacterium]
MASLTAAGIPLIQALEMVRDSASHRAQTRHFRRLVDHLNDGSTLTESLRTANQWLPQFDLALIEAGEQSGRLDVCFRFLAEYYNERARLARQILADLAYPAFILHFAVLILPADRLTRLVWNGDVAGFVTQKAAILLPLYAVVLLALYFGQSGRGERWRAALELILARVPVLGVARANLSLARLTLALESLLNAGVSIVQAWELAAAASGSPSLRRTVLSWRPSVEAGQTPAEAVRESRAFPDLFTNLYSTGEITGQLDETLKRLHRHYQEEAVRKLHAVAQWTPRLVYFLIVLLIAYQILSFWTGYFNNISQLTL